MTREEYECEWLKIFNGIEREKSEDHWSYRNRKDKAYKELEDRYISENAKYAIGDKVEYNYSSHFGNSVFMPKTKKTGFIHKIWAWTGDSRYLKVGTIMYGVSECFKNGKEKSISGGLLSISEDDIVGKVFDEMIKKRIKI